MRMERVNWWGDGVMVGRVWWMRGEGKVFGGVKVEEEEEGEEDEEDVVVGDVVVVGGVVVRGVGG